MSGRLQTSVDVEKWTWGNINKGVDVLYKGQHKPPTAASAKTAFQTRSSLSQRDLHTPRRLAAILERPQTSHGSS